MTFRFTLNSVLGAYILDRNPIGWDKAEILFKRSPKYHGVFYEKNVSLTFDCDSGKPYIDEIVDTYGIDTQITIKIEISCEGDVYDELFLGKLDLKTWSTETGKTTVNIIQEGIADTVMNRMGTVIDITKLETLDGTALTAFDYAPYPINLHSKAIQLISELAVIDDPITLFQYRTQYR